MHQKNTMKKIRVFNSSHPDIDKSSLIAGKSVLEFAHDCTKDDLVIVLISGGGSAMMVYPEDGVTFSQKSEYLNTLLLQGIGEREVNVVRKALSSKAKFDITLVSKSFFVSKILSID